MANSGAADGARVGVRIGARVGASTGVSVIRGTGLRLCADGTLVEGMDVGACVGNAVRGAFVTGTTVIGD
jgi:hypothetical protein